MFMETIEQIISRVLRERNLSQNKLGEAMGMSGAQVSDVLSGNAKPGVKFCRALASVVGLPEEYVLRSAGLLPPITKPDELQERANHLFDTLKNSENKQRALDYLEFLHMQEEKGNNAALTTNNEVLKPRR